MKKKLILLFTIIICNLVYSQDSEIKTDLKINILNVFSKIYEIQFERSIGKKTSIQVGFGFGNNTIDDKTEFNNLFLKTFGRTINNPKNTEYTEKTFTANIDFRFYLNHKQMDGLYISPSFQYYSYEERFYALEQQSYGYGDVFNFDERLYQRKVKLYNIRALIGYQLLIAKHIIFNPYFGPGYAFGNETDFFDRNTDDEKGIVLNYGIYFGVGF